jgi:hypothetical protein
MGESRIAQAFVDISARQTKLDADLNSARGKVERFASTTRNKMSGVGSTIGKIFSGVATGAGIGAGLGLFTSFASALSGIVGATLEEESSQNKLRATLRAVGAEVDGNAARINKLADALRDTANVDDHATRGLASLALNLGVGADKVDAYVKAAIGLAEATGIDATEAMEKLIKASQGSYMALQKQLPLLKGMATNEEKLAYISKLANQGLQERSASLNTASGSITQMKLATGELAEAMGAALAPAIIEAAHEATLLVKALTTGIPKAIQSTKDLAAENPAVAESLKVGAGFAGPWYSIFTAFQKFGKSQKDVTADVKLGTDALKSQADAAEKLRTSLGGVENVWKAAQAALVGAGIAMAGGGIKPGGGGISGIGAAIAQADKYNNFRFTYQAGPGRTVNAAMPYELSSEQANARYKRLKDERDQLSNARIAPDQTAQARIQSLNDEMTQLFNQVKGEGGAAGGAQHRALQLLNDKLMDAVRQERPGFGQKEAEGIYRKRQEDPSTRAEQLKQTAAMNQLARELSRLTGIPAVFQ